MQNSYNNQTYQPGSTGITYAGFWVRLAAYAIDSIIVLAGLLVVRLILSGIMAVIRNTPFGGDILFHYTLKDIVLYVGQVLYFILCTYYTGTTIGKRAMNLRVVCAKDQEKLRFLTVVYRETIGRFLSAFILCIGYIMVGIDKEKRGLHDFLSDTRVVYAKKVKVYPVYQRVNMPPGDYGQQVPPAPPIPPGGYGQQTHTMPPGDFRQPTPPVPPRQPQNLNNAHMAQTPQVQEQTRPSE